MNILIPDSWLREHLKTKATPKQIAKCLSLCSQSVEKIIKKNNDWVYEIEITTNRPDCLSVYGIARELATILPRFGIEASLQKLSLPEITKVKKGLPLDIKINKPSLCPRFTALIFDNITVKSAPKLIQDRLKKSGIRALNNVVDISNYLMLELGQPMHTFDYDKIKRAKMILRESKKGEKIVTLDKETKILPDGAIVIEDGEKRLIDLCGIMGGENSAVDEKTKRVLLFVQTYDPIKIRQACQQLAFRTEASNRFEKGVEPEGVIPAIKKAIVMFEKLTGARITSKLIDIYPKTQKPKTVSLNIDYAQKLIGIKIAKQEIVKILESLGFSLTTSHRSQVTFSIPHWRYDDISIPEDLIEEIARIYGYHNLPNLLPEGQPPQAIKNPIFDWENRIKDTLKFWGFTETASYSMVSSAMLQRANFNPEDYLKIANPLTENLVYMRPSLIPSLIKIISENQAEDKEIKIFELANIYLPQKNGQLPKEIPTLAGAITGDNFYQLKGIVEGFLGELRIKSLSIKPPVTTRKGKIFHPAKKAIIGSGDRSIGILGEIDPQISQSFGIKDKVIIFTLDFEQLVELATMVKNYRAISKHPAITEALDFIVPPKTLVGEMIQLIKSTSPIIQDVRLFDLYKNTRTFQITYQNPKRNLTKKEIEKIRKKIIERVGNNFSAVLRGQ